MPQAATLTATRDLPAPTADRNRAARILARSTYREMLRNGYDARQILAVATELIALVTEELRDDGV